MARTAIGIDGRQGTAVTVDGSVPGPLLRFREGEAVTLRVRNELDEPTSIHWHGLLLPFEMDGVPGVSFPGIPPGETFTYRYPVVQSGTYWYHSHTGLQEQLGHYGPLVIDPAGPDPVACDREHVLVLGDWMFANPYSVLAKLKKDEGYSNYRRRTVGDFFRAISRNGVGATVGDRLMWGRMRMAPTDIADVTGHHYTYLMNGQGPETGWYGLFTPGERVRLRVINAAAMSYFNLRIPGLPMTVVQTDGQNVEPVTVDELQIAVAETYDVVVEPVEDRAYTVFAEAMDRSGYARGTLAPREGIDGLKFSEVQGPIPFEHGERVRLTLVNDTMMEHPIHLHGMWMELENGQGEYLPRKHTINVKPAERLSALINADAPGRWAFHCHLVFHLDMGMFRVVEVSPYEGER